MMKSGIATCRIPRVSIAIVPRPLPLRAPEIADVPRSFGPLVGERLGQEQVEIPGTGQAGFGDAGAGPRPREAGDRPRELGVAAPGPHLRGEGRLPRLDGRRRPGGRRARRRSQAEVDGFRRELGGGDRRWGWDITDAEFLALDRPRR